MVFLCFSNLVALLNREMGYWVSIYKVYTVILVRQETRRSFRCGQTLSVKYPLLITILTDEWDVLVKWINKCIYMNYYACLIRWYVRASDPIIFAPKKIWKVFPFYIPIKFTKILIKLYVYLAYQFNHKCNTKTIS